MGKGLEEIALAFQDDVKSPWLYMRDPPFFCFPLLDAL